LNYNLDLKLEEYNSSHVEMSINRVSNDSYLNVFDQYVTKSNLRPSDFNKLSNSIDVKLKHSNFDFETGLQSFENLRIKNQSDRYQYVLPYYNFDKQITKNYFNGNINTIGPSYRFRRSAFSEVHRRQRYYGSDPSSGPDDIVAFDLIKGCGRVIFTFKSILGYSWSSQTMVN